MRSNLLALQGTADLMSQTQERLASGKKVNSAIDNPSSYYVAQSLSNRAGDLSALLDDMGQAVSTIKAANEGIESITSFVEQAKAVATSALGTTDVAARTSYMNQFNAIRTQIDEMAKDSGYKGVNLLGGTTVKLEVVFNEGRTNKLVINGVDASAGDDAGATGLKIKKATGWDAATGDPAVPTDAANEAITASINQTVAAIKTLRDYASGFGNNYSIVETRQSFTENLINVLEEGADNLTLADMNEESANMLALQTRQQLAINSLSLASQAAQSVLRLFS
jgi:flagellin-like hook-associated protein FlgL